MSEHNPSTEHDVDVDDQAMSALEVPELDPDPFDLDEWIDGGSRLEETVTIYRAGHLNDRLKQIEKDIHIAEAIPASERSVTDPSPEGLRQEWDQVAAEMIASGIKVRVRALTSPEVNAEQSKAKKAGVNETDRLLWVAAAGTVEPKFTAQQLTRLRDRIGEGQIAQLVQTVLRLSNEAPRPTAPFSRGSSNESSGRG
jgi:hypothetical protein